MSSVDEGEEEGGKEIFLRRTMCHGNYFDSGLAGVFLTSQPRLSEK
jgi:hypothetical protein